MGRSSPPSRVAPLTKAAAAELGAFAQEGAREVDLACPRCGEALAVVSFLTVPEVVDRVLKHVQEKDVELLFDPRAPPAA